MEYFQNAVRVSVLLTVLAEGSSVKRLSCEHCSLGSVVGLLLMYLFRLVILSFFIDYKYNDLCILTEYIYFFVLLI